MYKIEKAIYPSIVNEMFIKMKISMPEIRFKSSFRFPFYRSDKLQRNLRYRGVMCFNSSSKFVDYNCNFTTLKKRLKTYFLI